MTVEVTIPRNKWSHASDMQQMLSPDGRVDIFGAYLKALGVEEALLLDHAMPKDLKDQLPVEAKWTTITDKEGYCYDSDLAETIAAVNDYSGNNLAEEKREKELIELFATQDIKVIFYDTE